MEQDFETYLQQARTEFCLVAHRYNVREHNELRTAIDSLLIAYDQAFLALRKHSVVRGGVFETRSVPCAAVNHIGQIIHFTQNTPTELLGNEARGKAANAKLIAAAPDLLKSLKMMLSQFEYDGATEFECQCFWDAKQAVKKAEGQL